MKRRKKCGKGRGTVVLLFILACSLFAESVSLEVLGKDGKRIYFSSHGEQLQLNRTYEVKQGDASAGDVLLKKQEEKIVYGVVVKEEKGFRVGEKALLTLKQSEDQAVYGNSEETKRKKSSSLGSPLFYPLSASAYQKHYEASSFKADANIGNDLPKFLFHLAHALAQKSVGNLALPKNARVGVFFLYIASPSTKESIETEHPAAKETHSSLLGTLPLLRYLPIPSFSLPFIDYLPLSGLFSNRTSKTTLFSSDALFGAQFPSRWKMVYDALVYHLHNDKKASVVEMGSFFTPLSPVQIRTVSGQKKVLEDLIALARQAKVDVVILGSMGGSVIRLDAERRPFQKKRSLSVRLQLSLRAVDLHSGEVLTAALSSVEDRYSLDSHFVWRDLFDILLVGSGIGFLVHH